MNNNVNLTLSKGDKVIYLDPHVCQKSVISQNDDDLTVINNLKQK